MLEQRPIVKKSLYGTGAFMFVFAAAMGGTAFMISGGFGSGQHAPADPPAYQIAANDALQDEAAITAPERARVTPASLQAPAPDVHPLPAPSDANVVVISTSPPQASGLSGGDTAQAAPSITPAADAQPAKSNGT